MGKVIFTENGWDDYVYWQTQDRKTLKRINQLLQQMLRDSSGAEGIGKPEPLRGNLSGFWSRRIDAANRLVYRFSEDNIEVIACRDHYGEK